MKSIDETTARNLLLRAGEARENAYAPYSGFRVGAALLGRDGRVFTGCNVENVSYGAVSCAERNAVYNAIAAGCRDFEAIAVTSGGDTIFPCGICRQVLAEFSPNILVLCGNKNGYELYSLPELMPHSFRL